MTEKANDTAPGGFVAPWRFIPTSEMHHVPKGWGWERWVVNKPEYCGKLLHIDEGKKCSWHYHILKDEVFYILSGSLQVVFGDSDDKSHSSTKTLLLGPGEAFHVGRGLRHQMTAIGGECEFMEVSTTHYDSDSIRIEKGD